MSKTNKKTRKTILFAHHEGVIGGAERVTLATIEAIGDKYKTILLSPEGELQKEASKLGTLVHPINWSQPSLKSPLKTLRNYLNLIMILKKYQPSIVHTGDILALRALYFACRCCLTNIVCHVHFPYSFSFIDWVFKRINHISTFIYCSNELKENLSSKLSSVVSCDHHLTIHNGVDTKKFCPPKNSMSRSIQAIGIIANLQKRKGHDDFIHMAKILVKSNPLLNFHIIGGDILEAPRQGELLKLVKALGLTDKITFHGQVKDVKEKINMLDVVVCASHTEAFPLTILEAMACEKPIVTTNVNGITEAVDSSTAILVPPHDPEALAEGVQTILNKPEQAMSLAHQARQTVLEKYSSDIYACKVLQLYSNLIYEE